MVVETPAEERLVSTSCVVASLPVIGLRAQPSWKGTAVLSETLRYRRAVPCGTEGESERGKYMRPVKEDGTRT